MAKNEIAFYRARTDSNIIIFECCGRVQAFRVIPDSHYYYKIDGGTIRADHGATGLIDTLETMSPADLEKFINRIF